ncbi:hypothetical protein [Actinorugispora endophytica]|uniref:Uncharacterized protein n=1 Tax=Actinorugispora endophytica TaxID=1605990 RepID=A0A4R6UZK1_9ACTN|nr:hypothetical protein [Actinorugispora endophytica]TDQ53026.1 hypothetical protein EV190_105144 [Actinorugispora endophytica]
MTDPLDDPDLTRAYLGMGWNPPPSAVRALVRAPRWSQRRLRDADVLRLNPAQHALDVDTARADACALNPPHAAATASLIRVLWERETVGVAEAAALARIPVGVLRVVAPLLIDAALVTIDPRPGPLKVTVVAPTLVAERDFIADVTGAAPLPRRTRYRTRRGGKQILESTVSAIAAASAWPAPLCLVGSPRGTDEDSLWEDALRDTSLVVVLAGPQADQAAFNAVDRCVQQELDYLVVRDRDAPPEVWTPRHVQRWLRELELACPGGAPAVHEWTPGAGAPLGGVLSHRAHRARTLR